MVTESSDMTLPPINSFGTIPLPTAELAADPIQGIDEDQPLTVAQLNAILADFKGSVEHALARQEAAFEARLATVEFPDFSAGSAGVLDPGDDPRAADSFDAQRLSAVDPKEASVKSTVELASSLRLRMKRFELANRTTAPSAQRLIVAAIEEFLAKRGF